MSNRTYHPRGELVDGYSAREHPLYSTWSSMMSRCTNEKEPGYANYGGRGISVCDRWHHFRFFVEDMGPKPCPELTIERVDNEKGYSPENCIWESRSNQAVNRRTFKNNTTGATGIVANGASWLARFDYECVRYNIGWFATFDEASEAREAFVDTFLLDQEAAIRTLPKDKARHTSKTGVRGVTPHAGGGFTVRVTVSGERSYLGYFQSFEDACDARQEFLAKQAA